MYKRCFSTSFLPSAMLCLLFTGPVCLALNSVEEVVLIEVTPVTGTGLSKYKIPYNVQSANQEAIERSQSLSITEFLNHNLASISINEAQNNPLQADVLYRGFTLSPLLGLSQGISLYQNGVRINEPLGDTVNWDLLPESIIHNINLIGGANPLYGLNSLGGSLSIETKNGFNSPGHHLEVYGGSFERKVVTIESSGNNGRWGYYANVHYFDEAGWREESPSDAINIYTGISLRTKFSRLDLNAQHGQSDLVGNGTVPVELLELDRNAIFTAPDVTKNNMYMVSADLNHTPNDKLSISANTFYRKNSTASFNGDASDFTACHIGGTNRLLGGLEAEQLEKTGLDEEDICADQISVFNGNEISSVDELEDFLNALLAPGEDLFDIEDHTDDLSGTGIIMDEAINNISDRSQKSYGADMQFNFLNALFERRNQIVIGLTYFKGESKFQSLTELAELDPVTRSTTGLGTGSIVDEEATNINTATETTSFYFTNTIDVSDQLSLTVSGRINNTLIELADHSGVRPELNGEHDFFRFNPSVGLTYRIDSRINLYGGYSESSRAPTPIELACNDSVIDLAVTNATAAGEDPDSIEMECRLPNAFLADPPLQQVVAKNFELGLRGEINRINYHLGLFHSVNKDDILFQTTGRSTGLFANVDKTTRLGLESSFNGRWKKLDWYLAYSYIEATFGDEFDVLSPHHPFADSSGGIIVDKGDSIPGVPENQLKMGADFFLTDKLSIGMDVIYHSGQVIRGDESNQLDPLEGYAILKLRGRYMINEVFEVFAKVDNVFDTHYESFGLLGEDPAGLDIPTFDNFSNPRFTSPGAPVSGFVGVKFNL